MADSGVANYYVFRRTVSGTYDYNNPVGIAGIDSTKSVLTFNDFGLTPGTQYYYQIAAYSTTGRISTYSDEVATQTATSSANYSRVSNLKLLVAVYTTKMANVTKSVNAVKKAIEFYYRNSKGRLNLEPTFRYIDSLAPDTSDTYLTQVEADLRVRGVKDNQYDGIFVMGTNLTGTNGAHCILENTYGGYGYTDGKGYAASSYQEQHP